MWRINRKNFFSIQAIKKPVCDIDIFASYKGKGRHDVLFVLIFGTHYSVMSNSRTYINRIGVLTRHETHFGPIFITSYLLPKSWRPQCRLPVNLYMNRLSSILSSFRALSQKMISPDNSLLPFTIGLVMPDSRYVIFHFTS